MIVREIVVTVRRKQVVAVGQSVGSPTMKKRYCQATTMRGEQTQRFQVGAHTYDPSSASMVSCPASKPRVAKHSVWSALTTKLPSSSVGKHEVLARHCRIEAR